MTMIKVILKILIMLLLTTVIETSNSSNSKTGNIRVLQVPRSTQWFQKGCGRLYGFLFVTLRLIQLFRVQEKGLGLADFNCYAATFNILS